MLAASPTQVETRWRIPAFHSGGAYIQLTFCGAVSGRSARLILLHPPIRRHRPRRFPVRGLCIS